MRTIMRAVVALPAALLLWTWALTSPHSGDGARGHVPLSVGTGQTCHALRDPGYEISCGATAFGDLRHFRPADARPHTCRRTTAVTVRNTGRVEVAVTLVSGRREGDRHFSGTPRLRPGRSVTLRPGPGEAYVFDILLRSTAPGVGAIRVVGLS